MAALPPTALAAPFGLLGLAACWRSAAGELGTPEAVADAIALAGVLLVAAILAGWARDRGARVREDLGDPVLGPFFALVPIDVLLAGEQIAVHAPGAGDVVVLAGAAGALLLAGVLPGAWLAGPRSLDDLHGGYLLAPVAGPFVAAGGAAAAGAPALAVLAFGAGLLGWLTVGTIVTGRLMLGPPLPAALVPTTAILAAPPAVAGTAWLVLDGGRTGDVALGITGVAIAALVGQLALASRYRALRFGPGFLAFLFPAAAVGLLALRWIELERPPGGDVLAALVLAAVTGTVGVVVGRWSPALTRRPWAPAARPRASSPRPAGSSGAGAPRRPRPGRAAP